jgi:hypothetical protein
MQVEVERWELIDVSLLSGGKQSTHEDNRQVMEVGHEFGHGDDVNSGGWER